MKKAETAREMPTSRTQLATTGLPRRDALVAADSTSALDELVPIGLPRPGGELISGS